MSLETKIIIMIDVNTLSRRFSTRSEASSKCIVIDTASECCLKCPRYRPDIRPVYTWIITITFGTDQRSDSSDYTRKDEDGVKFDRKPVVKVKRNFCKFCPNISRFDTPTEFHWFILPSNLLLGPSPFPNPDLTSGDQLKLPRKPFKIMYISSSYKAEIIISHIANLIRDMKRTLIVIQGQQTNTSSVSFFFFENSNKRKHGSKEKKEKKKRGRRKNCLEPATDIWITFLKYYYFQNDMKKIPSHGDRELSSQRYVVNTLFVTCATRTSKIEHSEPQLALMSEKGLGMAVMGEVVGVGEVEEEEEEGRPTSAVADDTPIPARPLLSLNDVSSKPVLTKFEIKPMDLDLYDNVFFIIYYMKKFQAKEERLNNILSDNVQVPILERSSAISTTSNKVETKFASVIHTFISKGGIINVTPPCPTLLTSPSPPSPSSSPFPHSHSHSYEPITDRRNEIRFHFRFGRSNKPRWEKIGAFDGERAISHCESEMSVDVESISARHLWFSAAVKAT
ncbi:hypothetical protein V1477_008868 [Vespula maculifrons]|uniref:Uncharacterized protein n=1 Tax=Vespula maculifrons TaxID=7453 RepID=A0ABD2CE76_VESMC